MARPPGPPPPGFVPGPVGGGRASGGATPAPASAPASAQLVFILPQPDSVFMIDATPSMPQIQVEATITGLTPAAVAQVSFSWTVEVSFDESAICRFGKSGVVFTDRIGPARTQGGRFTPVFPWFRGGQLTITAEATTADSRVLQGVLKLWIFGTDPGWPAVKAELNDDTLRRIARHESGGIQFEADGARQGVPKLNRGKDGGGGICQITPPTPDDLWNWKTNVASGKRVFAEKRAAASGFPRKVAGSSQFQQLVQSLNQQRAQQTLGPLTVRVPAFDADQLAKDTIRGFNGYAGGLHEFRLSVVNGQLQVTNVNNQTGTADAVWERVPVADRPRSGDPDYVNHVLNTPIP